MSQERLYRKLPAPIKAILINTKGWLVGSSIRSLLRGEDVSDYDIIVPDRELFRTNLLNLNSNSTYKSESNSFGGVKYSREDLTIDIWCEELDHFLLASNSVEFIYNMHRNILLST